MNTSEGRFKKQGLPVHHPLSPAVSVAGSRQGRVSPRTPAADQKEPFHQKDQIPLLPGGEVKEAVEPTLAEVMAGITDIKVSMVTQQQFSHLETKLDAVDTRVRQQVSDIQKTVETVDLKVGVVDKGLQKVQKQVDELQKQNDFRDRQFCSRFVVIGGWEGSVSAAARLAEMDKLLLDFKGDYIDRVNHFKKDGVLATVASVEFRNKTGSDKFLKAVHGKKPQSGGKSLWFKFQKTKSQEDRNTSLKDLCKKLKKANPGEDPKVDWGEKKGDPRGIKVGELVVYTQDKFGCGGEWHKDYEPDADMDF